ncbi:hypothetical protein J421_5898 (plasmid) [Gemmatirosa kalamazoonensis]|uniref:AB hydrolase-1 domain-containing protein n=1 Tax=Gemmatirosa kalamazoonensis TaxID=861299 RepID=W0RV20_9BACT|nr:hypothetical protein [Gemmatirosa kalamazoonensis]AHG93433.1 hypothetical protein J421_5898 [Gemmatirosa kalamazoonensis]
MLRANLGGVDAPLVVVAHSLGSVIVSDYAWDAQHPETGRSKGDDDFVCMRTLAGLVTFGSNIPLFTLALPRVIAIAPPRSSPRLSDAVRAVARWENFYVSHTAYWSDRDFLGPAARLIGAVALAARRGA